MSRSPSFGTVRAAVLGAITCVTSSAACSSAGSGDGSPAASAGGSFSYGGAWGTGGSANGGVSTSGATGAGGAAPGAGGTAGGAAGSGAVPNGMGGIGADVTFDWPETVPGQAKPCQAGHYVGTFECTYQPAGTPDGSAGGLPISGPIDFTLTQTQNGEFLEVSGGSLDGLALLAIHFKAKITGSLSCGTGAFHGDLQDGSYAIDPFPAGGTFVGPMDGFSTNTSPCTGICLSGTWALHETGAAGQNHIGTCAGTWTATYKP